MVGYSEGTNGAKQMFAGKRDFTPQAKDSMTHKLFTPFYSDDQRANIDARRVGNPMGALQDVQQNDQFNPNNLDRDQAAVAPHSSKCNGSSGWRRSFRKHGLASSTKFLQVHVTLMIHKLAQIKHQIRIGLKSCSWISCYVGS